LIDVQQAWRDLAWLLQSPALLNPQYPRFERQVVSFDRKEQQQIAVWLAQLQQEPEALQQWLALKPAQHLARLGRYAETLIEFYLRSGPTHRLHAANIPIRTQPEALQGDHTTIGEIDYLLFDQQGQAWHWELAVKYFLCLERAAPTPSDCIGPDSIEVFEHKLAKLFDRQLRHRPPAPHADRAWQPAAYTRGWMFYHWQQSAVAPPWLHPNHARGHWVRAHEIQAWMASLPSEFFVVLDRQRWLSQGVCTQADELVRTNELPQRLQSLWTEARPMQRWPSGVLIANVTLVNELAESTAWLGTKDLSAITDQPTAMRGHEPFVGLALADGVKAVETSRSFVMPPNWPH
jgi:uncharacterized protein